MNRLLTIAPSPHATSSNSVRKLMYGIIIALIPAFIFSVAFYGYTVLVVTLISVVSCVLFEFLIQKFVLKTEVRISDGSAIITGLLLAFNVPSNLPWWIIIIGALVSIGIGKMTFGGLGNNPFNPALVGRVFLLISFPVSMTTYPLQKGFNTSYLDALTGETPLSLIKTGLKNGQNISEIMMLDNMPGYKDLFLGNMGGSLGEIATLALLIGFAYMLLRKIITWHIPVSVIGTVFIFSGILWLFSFEGNEFIMKNLNFSFPYIQYTNSENVLAPFHMADPVFHILTGGVMLGGIFMATDYVTSPMTYPGMIIFGIGIGLITIVIRVFGAYPEGISFAILIMNAFVPLLNKYIKPKRFGKEITNG